MDNYIIKNHIRKSLINLKISKENNIVYYKKDNILLFLHNKRNNNFWCSHTYFWNDMAKSLKYNHSEIEQFVKNGLNKYLNIKNINIIVGDVYKLNSF